MRTSPSTTSRRPSSRSRRTVRAAGSRPRHTTPRPVSHPPNLFSLFSEDDEVRLFDTLTDALKTRQAWHKAGANGLCARPGEHFLEEIAACRFFRRDRIEQLPGLLLRTIQTLDAIVRTPLYAPELAREAAAALRLLYRPKDRPAKT